MLLAFEIVKAAGVIFERQSEDFAIGGVFLANRTRRAPHLVTERRNRLCDCLNIAAQAFGDYVDLPVPRLISQLGLVESSLVLMESLSDSHLEPRQSLRHVVDRVFHHFPDDDGSMALARLEDGRYCVLFLSKPATPKRVGLLRAKAGAVDDRLLTNLQRSQIRCLAAESISDVRQLHSTIDRC